MDTRRKRNVMYKSNRVQFQKSIRKISPRFEKEFSKRLERIAIFSFNGLLSKTPVNSGKTVRNYILSMDNPSPSPAQSAIGTGAIEPTNKLPLGAESRRPANEAVARRTLKNLAVRRNPYRKIFISNNAETVVGLEKGELPGEPFISRSPKGMFALTSLELITRVKAGAI